MAILVEIFNESSIDSICDICELMNVSVVISNGKIVEVDNND